MDAKNRLINTDTLAVGAFGLTTSVTYGLAVAAEYLVGGLAGGITGMTLATQFASHKATLNRIFAGLVFLVALYIIYRSAAEFRL